MMKPRAWDENARKAWQQLIGAPQAFPVGFTYGDTAYHGFGGLRELSRAETATEKKETLTVSYALDETVTVRLEAAYWPQWGAREWTVYFTNVGTENSAVLRDIVSADLHLAGGDPLVRGILGDHENLYHPYCHTLAAQPLQFISDFGRPTHIYFPYFDIVHGDGGTMLALGWGGTWQADFAAEKDGAHVVLQANNGFAGYLKPGETVRTALIAQLPYCGRDEDDAANLWRGWYIDCSMPRGAADGSAFRPVSATCIANDTGMPNSDGSISERDFTWRPSLEKMQELGIHTDIRWFDAGWYTDPKGNTVESLWWHTTGSWELDRGKWPGDSFRESTDWARAHGMRTLVWFEPERITDPEALAANYGYDVKWALPMEVPKEIDNGTPVAVNNIGDPDCLAWTVGRITKFLGEQGVEIYREDNNGDSAASWRLGDSLEGENRTGITENKAVAGHYAMWDAIIDFEKTHGGAAFVDSCASGGGRNDLESMRRGVPFLRSDNDRTSTALRLSMTGAFNRWIPVCGASTVENREQLDADGVRDRYVWRASYLPILNVSACWTQKPETDFACIRDGIAEWNTVKDYLLKDFYPLTPWHTEHQRTGWTVWVWHDPETDKGVLQAFRMEDCPDADCTVALPRALQGKALHLTDADTGEKQTVSGSVMLHLDAPRSAALYYID